MRCGAAEEEKNGRSAIIKESTVRPRRCLGGGGLYILPPAREFQTHPGKCIRGQCLTGEKDGNQAGKVKTVNIKSLAFELSKQGFFNRYKFKAKRPHCRFAPGGTAPPDGAKGAALRFYFKTPSAMS